MQFNSTVPKAISLTVAFVVAIYWCVSVQFSDSYLFRFGDTKVQYHVDEAAHVDVTDPSTDQPTENNIIPVQQTTAPTAVPDLSNQTSHTSNKRTRTSRKHVKHNAGKMKVRRPEAVRANDRVKTEHGTVKCYPSFILNGVQKGGTTELSLWLMQHPVLARYEHYETHFWDCLANSPGKHRGVCGLKTWRNQPIESAIKLYTHESPILKESDTKTKCFEKSPSYFDLALPQQMNEYLVGAKVLTMLRNPTDRLYSAYWHGCKTRINGVLTYHQTCSIEHFMDNVLRMKQEMKEMQQTCLNWSPPSERSSSKKKFDRQFGNGRYHMLVREWYETFGSRYYLSHFEDFVQDPFVVVNEIQKFVDIPHFDFKQITQTDKRGFVVLDWEVKHPRARVRARHGVAKHGYEKLSDAHRQVVDELYLPCLVHSCDVVYELSSRVPKYLEQACKV